MALDTVRKKLDAARKDYEKQRKALGKELRAALVEAIATIIPEGWYVRWSHSDQMYNDEDYYWGFNFIQLVTLRVPRQGELIKVEVPRTYKISTDYWNRGQRVVDDYGSPAEYEFLLDTACEKRVDIDPYEEDPGVVDVRKSEWPTKLPFGLTKAQCDDVWHLIYRLRREELQQAFGDIATVLVFKNGKCKVNNESED